jgi:simple sugar transport system permease protein
VTGHDPLATYRAIFEGAGLNWFFPWITGADRASAAISLQQTLIATGPLILTGLAVAYAFRAGLFNIGGQGQYLIGTYVAVVVGSSFAGMTGWLHIDLAVVLAMLAGAVWAGIAGLLKAATGANEVITTIMLNYVAIWVGAWAFGVGGPLQNATDPSVPLSDAVLAPARLPVIWGDPVLQGLHLGIVLALLALGLFWLVLDRSRRGFEVRAVGFNPEAARYAGMSVASTYVRVMLLSGAFAGLAGALDLLGWQFQINAGDISASQVGFLGIAVALLGRNKPIGILLSAFLFAALATGTSVRHLDPAVFPPELATNLTSIIQGVIVLLVSADLVVIYVWRTMRRLGRGRRSAAAANTLPEATP